MDNREHTSREMMLWQKLWRMDNRATVYTLLLLLIAAAAVLLAFKDYRREISTVHNNEYPVAYSAVSGSDADVSPSDVAQRADSYLAQFREFDRTYCFEYWMQCQLILSEEAGYAPDEVLTRQIRADYDRYIYVVRTEREEKRAFGEKLVVCGITVLSAVIPAAFLGVNRLRRFMMRQELAVLEEQSTGTYGDIHPENTPD